MATLTRSQREVLLATSIVRGITLDQIRRMGSYRPEITVQSLLTKGFLETYNLMGAEDNVLRYFLTERGKKWRIRYKPKFVHVNLNEV